MATTESRTKQSGGHKYVDFDEFIDYQVRKTRSGIRATDLLTSVVVLALVVTSYLLAFVVADQWVFAGGVGYWPRVVSLSLLSLFVVGWTAWKLVIPYLRRVSALFAAREIEHAQPELKSSLLTLIDLKRAGRAVSPHIVAAMEKRAAKKLSATDIEQAVDRRLLMRLSYVLLGVVALACAYTVFSPKPISASVLRALFPSSSLSVATRTRIEAVDPGDVEVLARSQLEVTVDLSGEVPETATLLYSSADRSLVDEPITLRDTGEGLNRFRGVLAGPNGRGLLQNVTYRIVAGDAESRDYQVTVKQAPYATVTEVFLDYPDYMRLDDKSQPGGDIDAWEGTIVTVRAETNMPVASGVIERSTADDAALGSDSLAMRRIDDTHLEATWKLEFDQGVPYRYYRIDVKTDGGATDPQPRFYNVNIRADLPPEVRILHPTGDVELPANGTLPVAWDALDPDFMLRHVRMQFEQIGEDPGKFAHRTRRLLESPPEQSSAGGIEDVGLSEFNLEPGDVLSLWLEAKDNQAPLGTEDGNTTRTSRINITILDPVSRDEAREQLEQQREELRQELQESQQEAGEAGGEESAEGASEQQGDGDAEGAAGESETTEGESGETGEETTGGGETAGDEGAATRRSEGAEGNEQQTGEEGTEPGEREPGDELETGPTGEQPGTEPSADGERSGEGSEASEPRDDVEDTEALKRLIDEYNAIEEARREREQQQDAAEAPETDAAEQPGESPESGDSEGEGGESAGPETPSDSESSSGGPQQPNSDAQGTDRPPGDSETMNEGATGGEETPSDDPNADARPGDVENGTEGTATDQEGPAQPQRATGDEEGTARPETDPDAEPTPAQEPLDREGGDPATRPTEQPTDEPGENMPQDTGGGERPEGARPAPDSDAQSSESPGDRGGSQSGMPEADRPPARSDQQPSGPDQSDPEPGAREGQRSEQPSPGEQGMGQQSSEGTQGGSQQGPGDATSSPGSQSDAEGQPGGQPGDRPDEGSTSQPGGQQPGGEGMSEQSGEGGEGGEGGDSESGSQGEGSEGEGGGMGEGGQEGGGGGEGGSEGSEGGEGGGGEGSQAEGGENSSMSGGGTSAESGGGGGGTGAREPNGSAGSGGGSDSAPMNPNLEDKRRASELVLERLKDQLERGEAPDELLEDLGWTEDKLRDFMGRLEDRLADTGEDTSPEAEARRRQFETILEGIDYASDGQQRDAGDGPRESAEGFGSQRRSVPPEFQVDQEEYRRRISRQSRAE